MSDDLQLLHGNNNGRPAGLSYSVPANVLRGSAKLATRFANLFLSDLDPVTGRGTSFVAAMRRGALRTDVAVRLEFTDASFDLIEQLGDQSALPPSERLVRADLLSHSLFDASLTLTVQLTTADGTTDFILPIARV